VTTQTISIQQNIEPTTLIQNEDIRTYSFTTEDGNFSRFQQPIWQSSQKAVQSSTVVDNDKFEFSEIDSGFNSSQFAKSLASSQSGKIFKLFFILKNEN